MKLNCQLFRYQQPRRQQQCRELCSVTQGMATALDHSLWTVNPQGAPERQQPFLGKDPKDRRV